MPHPDSEEGLWSLSNGPNLHDLKIHAPKKIRKGDDRRSFKPRLLRDRQPRLLRDRHLFRNAQLKILKGPWFHTGLAGVVNPPLDFAAGHSLNSGQKGNPGQKGNCTKDIMDIPSSFYSQGHIQNPGRGLSSFNSAKQLSDSDVSHSNGVNSEYSAQSVFLL